MRQAPLGTLTVNSATIAGTLQIRINDADPLFNGQIFANNALTLQNATLNFSITGGAFQPSYVLAHYGTLTGNPFANVVGLPANYTLNYNYQNLKEIALVSNFPMIQTGDFNRDGHTIYHSPVRCKCVLQVVFRRVEGKIPNEQFCAHLLSVFIAGGFVFSRLFPPIGFQTIIEPKFT